MAVFFNASKKFTQSEVLEMARNNGQDFIAIVHKSLGGPNTVIHGNFKDLHIRLSQDGNPTFKFVGPGSLDFKKNKFNQLLCLMPLDPEGVNINALAAMWPEDRVIIADERARNMIQKLSDAMPRPAAHAKMLRDMGLNPLESDIIKAKETKVAKENLALTTDRKTDEMNKLKQQLAQKEKEVAAAKGAKSELIGKDVPNNNNIPADGLGERKDPVDFRVMKYAELTAYATKIGVPVRDANNKAIKGVEIIKAIESLGIGSAPIDPGATKPEPDFTPGSSPETVPGTELDPPEKKSLAPSVT